MYNRLAEIARDLGQHRSDLPNDYPKKIGAIGKLLSEYWKASLNNPSEFMKNEKIMRSDSGWSESFYRPELYRPVMPYTLWSQAAIVLVGELFRIDRTWHERQLVVQALTEVCLTVYVDSGRIIGEHRLVVEASQAANLPLPAEPETLLVAEYYHMSISLVVTMINNWAALRQTLADADAQMSGVPDLLDEERRLLNAVLVDINKLIAVVAG